MDRKITLLIDEKIYRELRIMVPKRQMSKFVEETVWERIQKIKEDDPVEKGFKTMGKDKEREQEARQWSEAGINEDF